jgi:hypothetical protein
VKRERIEAALVEAPCCCRSDYESLSSPYSDGDDGREQDCPHHGDGDPRNLIPTVEALVNEALEEAAAAIERAENEIGNLSAASAARTVRNRKSTP